jgi:hypothetical protein
MSSGNAATRGSAFCGTFRIAPILAARVVMAPRHPLDHLPHAAKVQAPPKTATAAAASID